MAEDSTKGLALAILGVVALVAVVGLLLVFWSAKSAGKVADGYVTDGRWQGDWAAEAPYRNGEAPQSEAYWNSKKKLIDAASGYDSEGVESYAPVATRAESSGRSRKASLS